MTMRRATFIACFVLFVVVAISLLWLMGEREEEERRRTVALGASLYPQYCASCHGANLEGQPTWQTPQADGELPAPPLNATGHASHHSEVELFRVVKMGMSVVSGHPSDMLPFEGVLSDHEIEAVIAYLKSTW